MTWRPDRLIAFSSSSSGSTPSRVKPPSRAKRRRLVDQRALDQVAHVGQIVELRQQAAQQRRLHVVEHQLDARDGSRATAAATTRSRGPAVPSAARATSRSRSWTVFSTSRNLPRSVERNASSSTASSRSRMRSSDDERTQQPGAEQPAAHRRDGAIDLVQQRPLRPALAAGDDLEMLQRDRIDEQAVGGRLVADGAHVREVGLLRVAEVRDAARRRPGWRPSRPSRPKPSRPCVFS